MAKVATMTPTECEQALGPRGTLNVTAENRGVVRKWLNAQGFPSLFSGGLSMRELALAYNDTTGKALSGLKKKLAEAYAAEANDEDSATADTAADTAAREKAVEQAATAMAAMAAETFSEQASGLPANTRKGSTVAAVPAATDGKDNAPSGGNSSEIQRAVAALTAALAAMGQTVDPAQVEQIARRVSREEINSPVTADAILKMIQTEAPKHSKQVKIELKMPDADAYREIEGTHHPKFTTLLKAASARQADGHHPNIWISGPAGSGKTYAAKMLAKALGAEFFYNGALSMPHELLGFIDAGGTYHETPFRQGYTGKAVYLFDEVDGSDNSALLALNASLANGRASFPNGQAQRHEDSIIIATANTWGLGATADYVGRAKIDAAFLSRFPVRIQWDYDDEMEQAICGNVAWAKRVQKARAKARAAGIKVLIDPRASIAGAALIKTGMSQEETAALTYLANLTNEQRAMVEALPCKA